MSKERGWTLEHKELICYFKFVLFYKMPALYWDKSYDKRETNYDYKDRK